MRKYELVCILDPQVGEAKIDGLVEKYETYLKSQGAEVVNVDRWGTRQLAYCTPSMRKRRQGYYVLYQFQAEAPVIGPLEEELRIDEAVLRHLVILIQGEFLRVPELVPESQIIFGPPPRDRGERGRERGRGRREREGAPGGRRAEGADEARAPRDEDGEAAEEEVSEADVAVGESDGAEA